MTTDCMFLSQNTPVSQESFVIGPECLFENNVTPLTMDIAKNKSDFMTLKQKIILTDSLIESYDMCKKKNEEQEKEIINYKSQHASVTKKYEELLQKHVILNNNTQNDKNKLKSLEKLFDSVQIKQKASESYITQLKEHVKNLEAKVIESSLNDLKSKNCSKISKKNSINSQTKISYLYHHIILYGEKAKANDTDDELINDSISSYTDNYKIGLYTGPPSCISTDSGVSSNSIDDLKYDTVMEDIHASNTSLNAEFSKVTDKNVCHCDHKAVTDKQSKVYLNQSTSPIRIKVKSSATSPIPISKKNVEFNSNNTNNLLNLENQTSKTNSIEEKHFVNSSAYVNEKLLNAEHNDTISDKYVSEILSKMTYLVSPVSPIASIKNVHFSEDNSIGKESENRKLFIKKRKISKTQQLKRLIKQKNIRSQRYLKYIASIRNEMRIRNKCLSKKLVALENQMGKIQNENTSKQCNLPNEPNKATENDNNVIPNININIDKDILENNVLNNSCSEKVIETTENIESIIVNTLNANCIQEENVKTNTHNIENPNINHGNGILSNQKNAKEVCNDDKVFESNKSTCQIPDEINLFDDSSVKDKSQDLVDTTCISSVLDNTNTIDPLDNAYEIAKSIVSNIVNTLDVNCETKSIQEKTSEINIENQIINHGDTIFSNQSDDKIFDKNKSTSQTPDEIHLFDDSSVKDKSPDLVDTTCISSVLDNTNTIDPLDNAYEIAKSIVSNIVNTLDVNCETKSIQEKTSEINIENQIINHGDTIFSNQSDDKIFDKNKSTSQTPDEIHLFDDSSVKDKSPDLVDATRITNVVDNTNTIDPSNNIKIKNPSKEIHPRMTNKVMPENTRNLRNRSKILFGEDDENELFEYSKSLKRKSSRSSIPTNLKKSKVDISDKEENKVDIVDSIVENKIIKRISHITKRADNLILENKNGKQVSENYIMLNSIDKIEKAKMVLAELNENMAKKEKPKLLSNHTIRKTKSSLRNNKRTVLPEKSIKIIEESDSELPPIDIKNRLVIEEKEHEIANQDVTKLDDSLFTDRNIVTYDDVDSNEILSIPSKNILSPIILDYINKGQKKVNLESSENICRQLVNKMKNSLNSTISIDTLNDLIQHLKPHKGTIIAHAIVLFISEETENSFNPVLLPGMPVMCYNHQTALCLMQKLRKDSTIHFKQDIYNLVMNDIEFNMFKLNKTPSAQTIRYMSSFYAILCFAAKQKDKLRTFCMDALYCLSFTAISVVYSVLQIWPHLFPKEAYKQARDPLVIVIMHLLITISDRDEFKKENLKRFIFKNYGYTGSEYNDDEILNMLMAIVKNIEKFSSKTSLTMAFVLFSKRCGPDWCYKRLITKELLPILDDDQANHESRAFVAKLIGPLVRPFPQTMAIQREIITKKLTNVLKKQVSQTLDEAIICSLCCFARQSFDSIVQEIIKWHPAEQISQETLEILKYLIRQKYTNFWLKNKNSVLY
ncbi:uncharacterized protein LOC143911546 isoform X2 [Arctopsyche grandis]|uniref:uncharacterized protein LOC143911546 isoform X2 n=1 Tax=Arctopsyche grandis TaxID=121162 RepID=UPI00406D7012